MSLKLSHALYFIFWLAFSWIITVFLGVSLIQKRNWSALCVTFTPDIYIHKLLRSMLPYAQQWSLVPAWLRSRPNPNLAYPMTIYSDTGETAMTGPPPPPPPPTRDRLWPDPEIDTGPRFCCLEKVQVIPAQNASRTSYSFVLALIFYVKPINSFL